MSEENKRIPFKVNTTPCVEGEVYIPDRFRLGFGRKVKDLTGVSDEEKHKHLSFHPKLNQSDDRIRLDALRKHIQELSQQNVFVRKVSYMARHEGLTELETLMQMVVVLAEENNRLQDELLKAEYQKAFSVSVSVDNASIEKLKPLLEAAYWYGEETGDYGMENIEQNESIMLLIASAAKG